MNSFECSAIEPCTIFLTKYSMVAKDYLLGGRGGGGDEIQTGRAWEKLLGDSEIAKNTRRY